MAQKASGWAAKAPVTTAAFPWLSAQGMRATFSSAPSAPALLQRRLPEGGAEVVTVEGAATLPGNGSGPGEAQRAKPALPRAGQEPETTRARGG
jgi:hypothetical protein